LKLEKIDPNEEAEKLGANENNSNSDLNEIEIHEGSQV